jgi:nucleoside-diphosphate-sugar epimerase
MRILLLGGNGELGPWVVKAHENRHELRITDINDPPGDRHEFIRLDVSDLDGVVRAAQGMDMIVNLAVLRGDRKLAFDVNTRGNYNMMVAARKHGIRRVVTTGPHFQLVGPQYEFWDFDLNPEMPAAPGTRLYALSKSLGGEICRIFSENYGIEVLTMLFYNMRHPDTLLVRTDPQREIAPHQDFTPFSVAWPDGGEAIRCAVEVDSAKLPSPCETFFVFADLPHHKFRNDKTRQVLGWRPRYQLEAMWNKPWRTD